MKLQPKRSTVAILLALSIYFVGGQIRSATIQQLNELRLGSDKSDAISKFGVLYDEYTCSTLKRFYGENQFQNFNDAMEADLVLSYHFPTAFGSSKILLFYVDDRLVAKAVVDSGKVVNKTKGAGQKQE